MAAQIQQHDGAIAISVDDRSNEESFIHGLDTPHYLQQMKEVNHKPL
jgi:hypothetical protein